MTIVSLHPSDVINISIILTFDTFSLVFMFSYIIFFNLHIKMITLECELTF
jgi:hypothetical protein